MVVDEAEDVPPKQVSDPVAKQGGEVVVGEHHPAGPVQHGHSRGGTVAQFCRSRPRRLEHGTARAHRLEVDRLEVPRPELRCFAFRGTGTFRATATLRGTAAQCLVVNCPGRPSCAPWCRRSRRGQPGRGVRRLARAGRAVRRLARKHGLGGGQQPGGTGSGRGAARPAATGGNASRGPRSGQGSVRAGSCIVSRSKFVPYNHLEQSRDREKLGSVVTRAGFPGTFWVPLVVFSVWR